MQLLKTLALVFAAAATTVSALEKPLDIEVTKAVECERKTKTGMFFLFSVSIRSYLFHCVSARPWFSSFVAVSFCFHVT